MDSVPTSEAPIPAAPASSPSTVSSGAGSSRLWWIVLGASAALMYGPTLAWLLDHWLHDPFYSHGLLVPFVCAWLIHRDRERLARLPAAPDRRAAGLVVLALLLHMAGVAADVGLVSAFSLEVAVVALVLGTRGLPALRALAFPLVYSLFALPIVSASSEMSGRVLTPMMETAAASAANVLGGLGLQVHRSGTVVKLPGYTMQVVAACSGMASVNTLMAIAALLGYLAGAHWWRTTLLVVAAVPIALLANVVRLTLTGLVGVAAGPALAGGLMHELTGVMTFMLGGAALLLTQPWLTCKTAPSES